MDILIPRMASSSLPLAMMEEGEHRNWTELPPELLSSIILRLEAIEIMENAQKVCRSCRRVCKDPWMWRKIDMRNLGDSGNVYYEKLCRHAVDLSQGGLVEIDIWHFGSDSLLSYIADSSKNLRSLNVAMCHQITSEGLFKAVANLPLLEDLEVSYCSISGYYLQVIGQYCPNLKTLKINCVGYMRPRDESDDVALAIAAAMPGLRHLQLFGNRLTEAGLIAIIKSCPNLEHLDLRQCFNVNLVGDLEKRCLRIKVLLRPNDSTQDYPYDPTVMEVISISSDDEYSSEDEVYYGHSSASDDEDYNSDCEPCY